ncbi:MAG TPA: transporter substrate-binding domain-containing protein [Stellaceae bacterium]|jgi:ABC-type amino acid transport substrate-binding protein|nr:transporter substrate-binding domain-containing protein [Stellaceae bacterium]
MAAAMLRWLSLCALVCTALIFAVPCKAQTADDANSAVSSQRELVVGTKETPPFAMKDTDGNWSGISIDLWRRIADELHLRYRFAEEPQVQGLIDGIASGKFDIAVAALTVTAARERVVDFTEPFYATGLGIAVRRGGEASWLPVIRAMTSFGFAQAVIALVGLALTTGLVVWLIERRHNEHFGGGVAKGVSAGVWWSTVAMTQRSTGEVGPRTMLGRVVAIVWMIASIITIAVFTASVTSVLTIRHLQGEVHDVGDLSSVRVGAVAGTSTEDTLIHMRITYRTFATPQDGLKALRSRTIDAFVYDKPLLAWLIRQSFSSSIELLDKTFDVQDYAFALPGGSPLRKSVNVAVLDARRSEWWDQTTFRYLGSK